MAKTIISQNTSHSNDTSRQGELSIWAVWWDAIILLRPAFPQLRIFLWFAVSAAGVTIHIDTLGAVSCIIRALKLKPCFYHALLRNFRGKAVRLDELSALWTQIVLRLFPAPLRINGRLLIVGDGIKIAKCGQKMPGVKALHQQSATKPPKIMGHSLQAVCLLVHAAQGVIAVPLAMYIHEGVVYANGNWKTLLDKMLTLLGIISIGESYYFIGDAYYAVRTMLKGLLKQGNHIITRVRSNAVACVPYVHDGPRKRGRPQKYGKKIKLASLFKDRKSMQQAASPVYGEKNVILHYVVRDLLWQPVGLLVRFVAVMHPTRGSFILMTTDTTLDPIEIIRAYGLRFKIEFSFKQAVHQIGSFAYRFWMRHMVPQRRGDGNQYLHRKPIEYREAVKRKMHAYHMYIQACVVSHGILQYLSAMFPELVWKSFGSWLRTIRPGVAPSEFVVAEALRNSLPYFLVKCSAQHPFAKFITHKQDIEKTEMHRMAA
jgi:hypothetical protein